VTAACSADCDWPPDDPAPPTWVWSASWLVPLELEEIAVADDVFACVAPESPPLLGTGEALPFGAPQIQVQRQPVPSRPSQLGAAVGASAHNQNQLHTVGAVVLDDVDSALLGLFTRTETFVFVGAIWLELAVEFARWFVAASCASDCAWPPDEPDPPTWVWLASWLVELALDERAVAAELFACVAEPAFAPLVGKGVLVFAPSQSHVQRQPVPSSEPGAAIEASPQIQNQSQVEDGEAPLLGALATIAMFVFRGAIWFEVALELEP
jgi:hypothetical protein